MTESHVSKQGPGQSRYREVHMHALMKPSGGLVCLGEEPNPTVMRIGGSFITCALYCCAVALLYKAVTDV